MHNRDGETGYVGAQTPRQHGIGLDRDNARGRMGSQQSQRRQPDVGAEVDDRPRLDLVGSSVLVVDRDLVQDFEIDPPRQIDGEGLVLEADSDANRARPGTLPHLRDNRQPQPADKRPRAEIGG